MSVPGVGRLEGDRARRQTERIERVLIFDAIEADTTGKCLEYRALEFISKVGGISPSEPRVVQRDINRVFDRFGKCGIPLRCRAK